MYLIYKIGSQYRVNILYFYFSKKSQKRCTLHFINAAIAICTIADADLEKKDWKNVIL